MDDRGVTLDPDPASVLCQETIILSGDLAFNQHWRRCKETDRRQRFYVSYCLAKGVIKA